MKLESGVVEIRQAPLLSRLVCPRCKGGIHGISSGLHCKPCGLTYPTYDDVIVMVAAQTLSADSDQIPVQDKRKSDQQRLYTKVAEHWDLAAKPFSFVPNAFSFLNYGYVPTDNEQFSRVQLPEHLPNRYCANLAVEVVGQTNLTDKEVLEVGCGRGGNITTMNAFFEPKLSIGIDLCLASVQFCLGKHSQPTAFFAVADAETLPFPEESFDVVYNLESSHAYPERESFYREVYRVLKPCGDFLYSDFLMKDEFAVAIALLEDLGFELLRDQDITSNVLKSISLTAEERRHMLSEYGFESEKDQKFLEHFLALPGSDIFNDMEQRRAPYRILNLKKTR